MYIRRACGHVLVYPAGDVKLEPELYVQYTLRDDCGKATRLVIGDPRYTARDVCASVPTDEEADQSQVPGRPTSSTLNASR